jgi:hypothetical protein
MIFELKLNNSGQEAEKYCQWVSSYPRHGTRKEIDTSSVGIVRKEKST